jgi:hypothetical protein
MAMQALAIWTCDPRFEQFCMVIMLLALAQVDMQADMTAGEEASRQAASLLQADWQAARKFPALALPPPQPCDATTTVVSARTTTPPTIDRALLTMLDWLLG